MFGLEFLVLFGFSFMLFPCEGVITAPPDMTEYTSLSGRTVNITWVFNDVISTVLTRAWSLTNTGGSLAEIYRENKPSIRTKLYDVDVVEPATLVLKNVNQSYSGIYIFSLTVSASSVFVTRSRSVRVFIAGGITSPPEKTKYTFLPGRTVKIKWTFDNVISSVRSRSWYFRNAEGLTVNLASIYRDNTAHLESRLFDIDIVKPATLVLKNVNQSHNGMYFFSLTAARLRFLRKVTVFVAKKPNATLNCFSPVILNEGDNFTCLCRGEGGNPPANVTWFKNGVKITDVGTENQTLNFFSVGREDGGTYKCVASSYPNENYTDEKFINVVVYYKPTNTDIVNEFSESPVVINGSVTITKSLKPKPTTLPIKRSTSRSLLNTSITDHDVNGSGKADSKESNYNGTKWYFVVLILVSGIILGILLAYIVSYLRRKFKSGKSQPSNPEPPTSQVDSTYQELDLNKMNKEDSNYQSLRRNGDNSTYAELNKTRDEESNYQSLT